MVSFSLRGHFRDKHELIKDCVLLNMCLGHLKKIVWKENSVFGVHIEENIT